MDADWIPGRRVILRPARLRDQSRVYAWLACSDITPSMLGPPDFPDHPIPTWDEFRADFAPHYFDGSMPDQGRCYIILAENRAVGVVCYNPIARGRTELDIWMRSGAACGKGYGPDALRTLCDYLSERFPIQECIVSPSARNRRAIRAYEKGGFREVAMTPQELRAEFGPRDSADAIVMVLHPHAPGDLDPPE